MQVRPVILCYNYCMATKKTPKVGDIGLVRIGGLLGWWVALGQHLAGDSCRYTHTFIVLDDNTVLAAQPGGARIDPLNKQGKAVYLQLDLTDQQRADIVLEARVLEGLPYGWLNYLAIALARFNIRPGWLVKYIASNKSMICSQLSDEVYRRAGIQLFDDGRLPGYVTPGDIFYRLANVGDWTDLDQ